VITVWLGVSQELRDRYESLAVNDPRFSNKSSLAKQLQQLPRSATADAAAEAAAEVVPEAVAPSLTATASTTVRAAEMDVMDTGLAAEEAETNESVEKAAVVDPVLLLLESSKRAHMSFSSHKTSTRVKLAKVDPSAVEPAPVPVSVPFLIPATAPVEIEPAPRLVMTASAPAHIEAAPNSEPLPDSILGSAVVASLLKSNSGRRQTRSSFAALTFASPTSSSSSSSPSPAQPPRNNATSVIPPKPQKIEREEEEEERNEKKVRKAEEFTPPNRPKRQKTEEKETPRTLTAGKKDASKTQRMGTKEASRTQKSEAKEGKITTANRPKRHISRPAKYST